MEDSQTEKSSFETVREGVPRRIYWRMRHLFDIVRYGHSCLVELPYPVGLRSPSYFIIRLSLNRFEPFP